MGGCQRVALIQAMQPRCDRVAGPNSARDFAAAAAAPVVPADAADANADAADAADAAPVAPPASLENAPPQLGLRKERSGVSDTLALLFSLSLSLCSCYALHDCTVLLAVLLVWREAGI